MQNRFRKIYNNFLRYNLFNKLLVFYSAVVIITLMCLTFFVCKSIINTTKNSELDSNSKILNSINSYLINKNKITENLLYQLYSSQEIAADFTSYLTNDYEEYTRKKLDAYYLSHSFVANDTEHFISNCLNADSDLQSIVIYSKKNNSFSTYEANNTCFLNEKTSYLKIGLPNNFFPYSIKNTFKDFETRKYLGDIYFNYNPHKIENSYSQYQNKLLGFILILTPKGNIIFDSSHKHFGNYTDVKYLTHGKVPLSLERDCYVNINSTNPSAIVAGIIPKSAILNESIPQIRTFLLIAIILIVLGLLLFAVFLNSYSKRTKSIMKAMQQLQEGNLSVRIPITHKNEDELNVISVSFNKMCASLNDYIEKVYLMEIKQKNAELMALQAQINPHFLYNTLESIRMRAITQNCDDVSEMIYILATFFRNSIKKTMIISIYEEINNCKLYLELFKIRYGDQLDYTININENARSFSIPKLAIQPLIENYIVHGIDFTKNNNHIDINVDLNNSEIEIILSDNGKGIDVDTLNLIKKSLSNSKIIPNDSVGIRNVSERLKLIYGEKYGIEIDSLEHNGTYIKVTIPAMKISEVSAKDASAK